MYLCTLHTITAAVKVERRVQVRYTEVSTTIGDFPLVFEIFPTCTHAVSELKVDMYSHVCSDHVWLLHYISYNRSRRGLHVECKATARNTPT